MTEDAFRAHPEWAARLPSGEARRHWAAKDLFHGLVRIEVAETSDPADRANLVSRWVLAERVPLAAPDARWDRMAYGVRAVEQALGAVARPAWRA